MIDEDAAAALPAARFGPGDTVSLVHFREVVVGKVRRPPRCGIELEAWLYSIRSADGRVFAAHEHELTPGGVG